MEGEEEGYRRIGGIVRSLHSDGRRLLDAILTTCEEMLADRGCAHVTRVEGEALDDIVAGRTPEKAVVTGVCDGRRTRIHLCVTEGRVGIKFVRALQVDDDDELVVLSADGPTPFAKREGGAGIQFLLLRGLLRNVTRHALVPWHEPVDASACPASPSKLPRILTSDPVVQYYNWPPGTRLRIHRAFGGSEPIAYFRMVVMDG